MKAGFGWKRGLSLDGGNTRIRRRKVEVWMPKRRPATATAKVINSCVNPSQTYTQKSLISISPCPDAREMKN